MICDALKLVAIALRSALQFTKKINNNDDKDDGNGGGSSNSNDDDHSHLRTRVLFEHDFFFDDGTLKIFLTLMAGDKWKPELWNDFAVLGPKNTWRDHYCFEYHYQCKNLMISELLRLKKS